MFGGQTVREDSDGAGILESLDTTMIGWKSLAHDSCGSQAALHLDMQIKC